MKRYIPFIFAFGVALAIGSHNPAWADSVGKILAIIDQIFGGHINTIGASTGQVLTKQADGSVKFAAVTGGTQGLPSVLATDATTGSNTIICTNTNITDGVGSHLLRFNSPEYESQPFYVNAEQHLFPGGPRPDVIYSLGYNMDPNDVPSVLGEPACGWFVESYYNTGPNEFLESYWSYCDKNGGSPGQHRFLAFQVDRNSNTTGFDAAFGFLKRLGFGDQGGNTPFEFDFGVAQTPTLTLNSSGTTTARFYNTQNNQPWLIQSNAAGNGSFELARLDGSNNVVIAPDGATIKLHGAVTCDSTVTGATFGGTADTTCKAGTTGNILHLSCGATVIEDVSTSYALFNAPLLDGTNATHDIGSAANAFKDLYLGGVLKRYKGVVTAGFGQDAVFASGTFVTQASLQTSIATFTPGSTGTFIVRYWMKVKTLGSMSINAQVAYSDEDGAGQTQTIPLTNLTGTTTSSAVTATSTYYGIAVIRASNAAITVKEVGTTATSHDGGATIEQIQ
jgi:hypothetical protein